MVTNGEKVLDAMNAFDVNASSGCEELPFESLDDFSVAPLTFEETAVMVWRKTEYFFDLTAKFNRKSEKYLEACSFLEKGVKYLGSCCLTAAAVGIEDECEFPKLEGLSTHWLFGLVSFNIRKLDAAVNEFLADTGDIPGKWLDMQFRFLNLAERLKATERKIYDCSKDSCNPERAKIVSQAKMFTKGAWNRYEVRRHVKPPVFRTGAALPMIRSAADHPEALPAAEPEAVKEVTPELEGGIWEPDEMLDRLAIIGSMPLWQLNKMQAEDPEGWAKLTEGLFDPPDT